MENNRLILTCKRVRFYSYKDEDAFFECIKKINCIENISGQHDELYLHITSIDLHDDDDLDELIGLFYRYKIDMSQLNRFLNKSNKERFFDSKKAYWHKKVFGADKK